jgi:thymidylate synthase
MEVKQFPLLTNRKMNFKAILGEFQGFLTGCDSAKQFRELGCNYWNKNANDTVDWIANPFRKGEDDLGRIYSKQWTELEDVKIFENGLSLRQEMFLYDNGYTKSHYVEKMSFLKPVNYFKRLFNAILNRGTHDGVVFSRKINQVQRVIETIIADPSDRRLIINGWNLCDELLQSLPACHTEYVFTVLPEANKIDLSFSLRSNDLFLGTPSNIASAALLLSYIAYATGYLPGKMTMNIANAHIYENHLDQVRQLIDLPEFPLPQLNISGDTSNVRDIVTETNFELFNYEHGPLIKADMAA